MKKTRIKYDEDAFVFRIQQEGLEEFSINERYLGLLVTEFADQKSRTEYLWQTFCVTVNSSYTILERSLQGKKQVLLKLPKAQVNRWVSKVESSFKDIIDHYPRGV